VDRLGEAVLYAVALGLAGAVVSMFVQQLTREAIEATEVILTSVLLAGVGAGLTSWLLHRPAGR